MDSDGTYHAPGPFLERIRRVWVKATDAHHPERHGTAMVEVSSDELRGTLRNLLGHGWRQTRLERLAGSPPETGALGIAADPVDAPSGHEARFADIGAVAAAPRIPVAEGGMLRDHWLVAERDTVRLVSASGAVRTFARRNDPRSERDHTWPRSFRLIAVKPWRGPHDRDWESVLVDANDRLWQLDATGRLTERQVPPLPGGKSDRIHGLALDRAGNVYLSCGDWPDPVTLRQIAPDGSASILAGGPDAPSEMEDGVGQEAGLINGACLTLDEPGTGLFFLDSGAWLRRVDLASGRVTTLFYGGPALGGRRIEGLACHRGLVLAFARKPSALFLIDPRTRRSSQVMADSAEAEFAPGPGPGDRHRPRLRGRSLRRQVRRQRAGRGLRGIQRTGTLAPVLGLERDALTGNAGWFRIGIGASEPKGHAGPAFQ